MSTVQARELTSGALIGVGTDEKGYVIEATVSLVISRVIDHENKVLAHTLEYDYPFAIDADREIQLRND